MVLPVLLGLAVLLAVWLIFRDGGDSGSPELEPVTGFAEVCDPDRAEPVSPERTVLYSVETRGDVPEDLTDFAAGVEAILTNPCGWARAGVEFARVDGDPELRLALASQDEVAAAAEGCSAQYSCRVQDQVLINDARWRDSTDLWREQDLGLGAYRHMAVNHEVGHYLGLEHTECVSGGEPAPLMQQQSKGLNGCTFNPWPLPEELAAVRSAN